MSATFQLKCPSGWFAAGREVQEALMLLSDSAFRVFLWLCLHAERKSGSLRMSPAALAPALRRTVPEIRIALDELCRHGVCDVLDDIIQIADSFWPYRRMPCSNARADLAEYVAQVKRCFLARRCVRSSFTPADGHLAAELYWTRLSVEDAERAILLGSVRKYVSWKNHGIGTPITTLHYFRGVFDELRQTHIPAAYWNHITHTVAKFEQEWDESRFTRFIPQQEKTK
jgi:hypothetical protein